MSTLDQSEIGAGTPASETNQHAAAAQGPATEPDARRPRASMRIPFDGVVEVGGELGPPFEAQAVDVSGTGMHLRTAYLPAAGQTLSCRFEAGRETVVATGEVVWQKEAGRGGEFGLRFVDLDAESALALERMTDRARLSVPGAKVRLHIDGLGAPMRARVKGASKSELTVGSELGFLQVGKAIDLEDAESGNRRPASIDRVDVEIDPGSRVPQLVVSLKYDDAPEMAEAQPANEGAFDAPQDDEQDEGAMDEQRAHGNDEDVDVAISSPTRTDAQDDMPAPHHHAARASMPDPDVVEDSMRMKSPVARAAAKVTPALERFAKRTKVTAMLLIEKAKAARAKESESSPIRRMTSPPPGGGLHTAGRKVVRAPMAAAEEPIPQSRFAGLMADKKKMMMIGASGVMVLAIGAAVATKKAAPPPAPSADPAVAAAVDPAAAPGTPNTQGAAIPGAPATPPGAAPTAPMPTPISPTQLPADPAAMSGLTTSSSSAGSFGEPVVTDRVAVASNESKPSKKHPIKVAPFSYGNVARGNLLRLKMDGAIEKIQGAQQPTGFTVHIPGRRSLEPAAPLAARDARIGSIKVVNDPGGAELAVTFKDGVPSYTVRAKGDQLEIVLASPNAVAAKDGAAKKDDKPTKVAKRDRHPKKHAKH